MVKRLNMFSRWVYGIVGIVGILSMIWSIFNWNTFINMPVWSIFAFIIAVIGMLNWGIVALSNDRNKDLFGLVGA